jgi:hypothetical protein
MKYQITPEQLDKVIKPYFDKVVFKDSKWGEKYIGGYGETWYGLFNQDGEMLVGYPESDSSTYYTDGTYFSNMWEFFSVDAKEFTDAIGRYIKKTYGCEFDYIW